MRKDNSVNYLNINFFINPMLKKIMGMSKQRFAIIVLCILLAASLSYIGATEYKQSQQEKLQQAYVQGYNQGVTNAVSSLYQQTNNCQAVNIFMGESSKQVIDVACLQKQ
jgi:hypothetical protein